MRRPEVRRGLLLAVLGAVAVLALIDLARADSLLRSWWEGRPGEPAPMERLLHQVGDLLPDRFGW